MNNSALESKEYESGIENLYTKVISEYGQCVPKALLLDYFKLKIKEFSIALGIQKAQNYRDECKSLESLDNLDKKITPKKETIMYSKKKESKASIR